MQREHEAKELMNELVSLSLKVEEYDECAAGCRATHDLEGAKQHEAQADYLRHEFDYLAGYLRRLQPRERMSV